MIINIHAGHCPQGQGASGAVGILQESVEDRKVKDALISVLRGAGHTVYDCTCDENTTQNGCLGKIVAKCNEHSVDYDCSIHLNSGRNDYAGDQSTGGVEVWCYDEKTKDIASRICAEVSGALGITNRGVKYSKNLYVLRKTKAPAFLVECCFVDDKDDADRWDADKCAKAIASGIMNQKVDSGTSANTTPSVAPTRKSNEEIADEVIAGKWGSQPNRQRDLEAHGYNYEAIRAIVNAKCGVSTPSPAPAVSYYPAYSGGSGSIVTGLNAVGVDSSYYNRCNIAAKNGISGYKGTAQQNTTMLNLLKQGKLKK